jgi:hypothetical protein
VDRDLDPALLPVVMVIATCLFVAFLIPYVFYLLTLQRALSRCAPSARTMSPAQVWLALVPVVNVIWPFFYVPAIAKSLRNEFARRGMRTESDAGRTLGFAMAILQVLSIVPFIGFITSLPALVVWILYWVKVAGLSKLISQPYAEGSESAAPEPSSAPVTPQ